MPIEFLIDAEERRVLVWIRGATDREDLFRYQREVWSRPELAGYDELIDASEAVFELPARVGPELEGLAHLSAGMDVPSPSRLAVVASGELAFGLGRMYAAYRNTQPGGTRTTEVFRTRAEALRWLDAREAPQAP